MTALQSNVYAILLAGGTGTRMWPVSRTLYPKQLVKFIGQDSLIQNTIKRLLPIIHKERVRVVCGQAHEHEMARHLSAIGIDPVDKIICEPCGRNTAPAILLAVLATLQADPEAIFCIFPADHVIDDLERFHGNVGDAVELARKGYIVTFGIQPHYPETGYGYIEGGQPLALGAQTIRRFVEKPDLDTAQEYLEAGNFFWNSGMFCFQGTVAAGEYQKHQPELFSGLSHILAKQDGPELTGYGQLPDISIDYAIMEKTDCGAVLPSRFRWSDIGSWKSLYDFLPKDKNQNVVDGDVLTQNTNNCFIMGNQRLIAANHLQNLIIVETPDAVFVSDIDNSREVKSIVTRLKDAGRREHHHHPTVHYPWGRLTQLEEDTECRVARRQLYPSQTCYLNPHDGRQRSITVVQGKGKIQVGSDGSTPLIPGTVATISAGETAVLTNVGEDTLHCIETIVKGM